MLLFRIVGYLLALVGIGFLIVDGARSIAAGELDLTPFGRTWYEIAPESLDAAKASVEQYVHPFLWDPVIETILGWPTFAVALGLATILVVIGRPRRQTVANQAGWP